ncbi:MAG: neutral/alkaline non-lysosomal ceramidase N-terminal domain-containing protein [Cyclobacteriaceae bacterium]
MGRLNFGIVARFSTYLVLGLGLLCVMLFTFNDRSSYKDQAFYLNTIQHLEGTNLALGLSDSIAVGWSRVNITPNDSWPLAGYGARKPKEFDQVYDSIFARALVVCNEHDKAAIVSVDLLIIPPLVTKMLREKLLEIGWSLDKVYLTATHSHSSIGGWQPGPVGKLFAGDFDPQTIAYLTERIIVAIENAELTQRKGSMTYGELSVPDMVKNRLVGEQGIVDPWLKVLMYTSSEISGLHATYSAHATCIHHQSRALTADYPGELTNDLVDRLGFDHAMYSAGAVASMGPKNGTLDERQNAKQISRTLSEQIELFRLLEPKQQSIASIKSFRFPIELRKPMFKLFGKVTLRPWIFYQLTGGYETEISGLILNDLLYIGLPCDFSGELAIPLYDYARDKGLNLIITSFNGGYIGYIPHDKWYDLDKYETKTMAWYGFDNGAYFSEVIRRVIDKVADGNN